MQEVQSKSMHGTVMFYNKKKGLGGVRTEDGMIYYFHPDTKIIGSREPKENDTVSFTFGKTLTSGLLGVEEGMKIFTMTVAE